MFAMDIGNGKNESTHLRQENHNREKSFLFDYLITKKEFAGAHVDISKLVPGNYLLVQLISSPFIFNLAIDGRFVSN